MKTLPIILSGLLFVVFLSGCSVYQHVKLSSDMQQNDKSEFLIENDSVSIIYSFYGNGGPIHIELFNKLDKPLYIDWGKSALITNGQSKSLWKDEARITANATEYKVVPENSVVSSTSDIEGTIVKNDKMTFIPPHANISANRYVLQSKFFTTPVQLSERKVLYTDQGKVNARKFSFSKEDSPLSFRIFLSVSDNENFKNPIQFDNSFWVSDYFATSVPPSSLGIIPGNQFYVRKNTAIGRTLFITSIVGILTVAAIAGGEGSAN
jgi:hypothetical protein